LLGWILILILLLILSGFFSSIEIAIFSLSTLKVKHLVHTKVPGAELLHKLRKQSHKLLITILIGNNLVNIGAASLATVLAIDMFGSAGAGIATGVLTLLILVFGEITPKAYATRNATKLALAASKPLYILMIILFPVIFLLDLITSLFVRKSQIQKPTITEDEIKHIVKVGSDEGQIEKQEKDMIYKIFKFNDLEAKDIMVPKHDVFILDEEFKLSDILHDVLHETYSRIPVFKGNYDNISGIVWLKDVLKELTKDNRTFRLKKIVRPALVIPETKKIDSLLVDLQETRNRMAIVVDEYGSFAGVVTMEDILEQIVGEIYDEDDKINKNIVSINKNEYLVYGSTPIIQINDKLKLDVKSKDDFTTIGGLILDKTQKIPKANQIIRFKNFTAKIKELKKNRIEKIIIKKI
jgi:putative hemolysin